MPYENAKVAALIVAAGSGSRMKTSTSKQYLNLHGTPVILHTLGAFIESEIFDEIIVVLPNEDVDSWGKVLYGHLTSECNILKIAAGGSTRQESVLNGLYMLSEDVDIVAIHDGVRPFVEEEEMRAVIKAAISSGSATLGSRVKETVKQVNWEDCEVFGTIDRNSLCAIKTPQAFKVDLVKLAHKCAFEDNFIGNDDCELVERLGHKVMLIEGSSDNIKITTKEDMIFAENILGMRKAWEDERVPQKTIKSGIGYDAHKLVEGRALILGGVAIPFHKGLLGHSDADVLVHSICDALLGAAALGDIGMHFDDSSGEFFNISSLVLLERVVEMLGQKSFKIINIDATIVAQQPKLAPFFEEMVKNISEATKIDVTCVNVKGTTTEGMGFTGAGEGISAYAIATIAPLL